MTPGRPGARLLAIGSSASLALTLVGARLVFALSLDNLKPKVELSLKPGGAERGAIEVVNRSGEAVQIKAYLQDWRYKSLGDGSKTFTAPDTSPRSCAGWISFYPQEMTVPPNGRAVIDYTVRAPQDATLQGGYYAVLFVQGMLGEVPNPVAPAGTEATVKFAASLGSLFLVEVDGTVTREGRLALEPVAWPTGNAPLTVRGRLRNEGNAFLHCTGSFHVVGAGEVVVARGKLPDRYVWPEDEAAFEGTWSGELPAGTHPVVVTYDCGGELVLVEETVLP